MEPITVDQLSVTIFPYCVVSPTPTRGSPNPIVEQMLRATIQELDECRKWTKLLPTIEFVINSLPNKSIGYSHNSCGIMDFILW